MPLWQKTLADNLPYWHVRRMETFASALIDALGGTTRTAELMNAPLSTVHNMRTRKLTGSRLDHLRRIARDMQPPVDVSAIAARFDIELDPIQPLSLSSSGNGVDLSAAVSA